MDQHRRLGLRVVRQKQREAVLAGAIRAIRPERLDCDHNVAPRTSVKRDASASTSPLGV